MAILVLRKTLCKTVVTRWSVTFAISVSKKARDEACRIVIRIHELVFTGKNVENNGLRITPALRRRTVRDFHG